MLKMLRISSTIAVLAASTIHAEAAARLFGTYTGEIVQLCQAIGSASAAPIQDGNIEVSVGTFTFDGKKVKMVGVDYAGPSVAAKKSIETVNFNQTVAFSLSGSANPYSITLAGNASKGILGQVDRSGIAHHAVLITAFSDDSQPAKNCINKTVLTRQ